MIISTNDSLPKIPKWIPGSETSISRLSYRLGKLSTFLLLKAKVLDSEGDYLYPRKQREYIWQEVMNTEKYKAMGGIAVVNTRTPTHNHEDYPIIPWGGLTADQRISVGPETINLTYTILRDRAHDHETTLTTMCSIYRVLLLDEEKAAGIAVYQKGLGLLLQPRIASLPGSGPCRLSKFHAMEIPSIVGAETSASCLLQRVARVQRALRKVVRFACGVKFHWISP